MSRSYKKTSIVKDNKYREYWRKVRRVSKQFLKMGKDIPDKKTIVNDYDWRDWEIHFDDKKYLRK